jgi:hypothetical protein
MADPTKPRVRVSKGREHKRRSTYLVQVVPGNPGEWFRLRRADLAILFMEGILPTPILAAVDRLQDMRRTFAKSTAADESSKLTEALNGFSQEDRDTFLELVRRAAVAVVIEPRLTHSKRKALADPDVLWVGGISDVPGEEQDGEQRGDVDTVTLMTIWRSVLGEAGVVTMLDSAADEFRESESPVDDPVVRDGDTVRTEAVVVDSDAGAQTATPVVRRIDYH